MTDYLIAKFNIEKSQIPSLLITYKVIATTSYIMTLAICYKYKPVSTFIKSPSGVKFNSWFVNKYPTTHNKFMNMKNNLIIKVCNNKYIKKIPESIGLKSKRFTKAFIENTIFAKLTFPITIPIYFYLSVMYVKQNK
jgi:hypothetical protein